jgi:FAD/FMN-containing dehydrogenase
MTDFSELRSRVPLLEPGDPGYAAELAGFNLLAQHRPDAVVAAETVADVVETVLFARGAGLAVRAFATGHGSHEDIVDGIVIATGRLDSVSVDAAARTATIGGGVRWSAVVEAAAVHGLAPICGSSPTVGAIGYLLGGGLGPLARSHGFSSDWVRGFTVVTGTGEVVEAAPDENPDLYWALRGGKGGLGVVIEARVELAPIAELYGGNIMFPTEAIEPVLRAWVAFTATAPADVTTSVAIMRFPPIDLIPEFLRGKTLLNLRFAYPGSAADGEAIIAPLRAVAPSMADSVRPLPLTEIATIHADPVDPSPAVSGGGMIESIDQDFATALLAAAGPEQHLPLVAIELRHVGSATRTDVADGSSVGGRGNDFTYNWVAIVAQPGVEAAIAGASAGVVAAIAPWISASTTPNFVTHGAGAAPFESAWTAEAFERLTSVRSTYDPSGVFAFGH